VSYQPPQGPQGAPPPPQWPQSPPQGQQPQQPPAWGQPGYTPPPSKPKPPIYRRPWFMILGILGLIVIVGALVGDPPAEEPTGGQTEERQAQEAEEAPATEAAPGIGDSVRDGNFEFVVTAFQCAGGQCRAAMRVENIGSDPGEMFAANQYLFDTSNRKFEADSSLTDALFFQELNPGQKVSGKVIWRVPGGFKPDHLELHDSAFSGGVEVEVS
jgi:hypothetical protein